MLNKIIKMLISKFNLKVDEIKYSINENGYIKIEKKLVIFPKTRVRWKDRAKENFNLQSDTVQHMLGIYNED